METIKKYWYFFLLGVFILFFIITKLFSLSKPIDKLKTYLISDGFTSNAKTTELQKIYSISEDDYNELETGVYKIEAFNYEKSNFNYIYKEKINGVEDIYAFTLNILNGKVVGMHTLYNEYNEEWNIKGTYNLSTNEFKCDTKGYKGLNEYCDDIKSKIMEYESQVSDYLTASKTSKYYFKKMY